MTLSTTFANEALDRTFAVGAYTVGLFVGSVEVSAAGYARQSVAFAAASGGTKANNADIAFPAAGAGGWGTVTHFALYEDATLVNRYLLTTPQLIAEDAAFQFAAGALIVSIS